MELFLRPLRAPPSPPTLGLILSRECDESDSVYAKRSPPLLLEPEAILIEKNKTLSPPSTNKAEPNKASSKSLMNEFSKPETQHHIGEYKRVNCELRDIS